MRPTRYARGVDLPLGTYHLEQVNDGFVTVVRTIGAQRWVMLTAREDPAVRAWPTRDAARAACCPADYFDCADWPHWGQV